MKLVYLLIPVLLFFCPSMGSADFTPIGPFTGDRSENFDAFGGGGGGHLTLDIFDAAVTLNMLTDGGAIKLEFGSTLIVGGQSDTVSPRSAPTMMGQLGILEWNFNTPVSQFGGYFENNSFADHVEFEFYGGGGQLLASVTGNTLASADTWTWNGWESDTPIYRAVSTGNNAALLNGFIWYDDMQITFAQVPEPTAGLVLAGAALLGVTRRRTRTP